MLNHFLAMARGSNFHLFTDILPDRTGGKTYESYLAQQGPRKCFRKAFIKLLDDRLRKALVNDCWVYRDDPIGEWADLHLVRSNYREEDTPE